jgi:hypothetical protein
MEQNSAEYLRLTELYSAMHDSELEKLAAESAELSDDAYNALQAEITRRGLPISLSDVGTEAVELQQLVTIRQFRDLPAALMAKGALDAASIECHLADDNMVRTDWFISNLLGGVKLNVRPDDAEEAIQILDQPLPEGLVVEGIGEFRPPHCPSCNSAEVAFEAINRKVFLATAAFLPLPLPRNSWKCYDCGATWQEDDDSPELQDTSD